MSDKMRPAVVHTERMGAVLAIVIDNPPVNAGSQEVRQGILDAVETLRSDPALVAGVIIGAGKTFISGSDIREFSGPLADPQVPAVIRAIETCGKPVVAAIHGAALGGGYEIALGCDLRVSVPDAVVGLPEVRFGIIPGAGGTQRLPRLVGRSRAIELIAGAARVPARQALAWGMLDVLVEGDLKAEAARRAADLGEKRLVSSIELPAEEPASVDAAAKEALRKGRGRPAIAAAIEAVRMAGALPFDEGLRRERATFQELRASEEAAALRHLFFAGRLAGKLAEAEGIAPAAIENVAVVGGGTMGAGIVVAFLEAGMWVFLLERDHQALEAGLSRVRGLYDRMIETKRLSAEAVAGRLRQLTGVTQYEALQNVDLAVEAVFEDMAVKEDVLRRLDRVLRPGALLASNTSYLDINKLASATDRAGQVLGLHFFSPAHVMKLVEVVRGEATEPAALAGALHLVKRLGKIPVVSRVGEGFIGNRIYSAYRSQCEFMLEDGAYPEDVDAALTAFGFAMGPFAVGDMSGLDIAWRTRQRLRETRNPAERYVDVLDKLCEQGRFGRKAGAGWYRYEPGASRGQSDPIVHALINEASQCRGITRRALSAEEIVQRALGAMVNEASLLLAENIAQRPSDIDIAMVNGYGFPDYRGGPIFWASRRSAQELRAMMDVVARASGPTFEAGPVETMLKQLNTSS